MSVTLGYARIIGGLRGQTLTGTGQEALLLSYETSNESGGSDICTAVVSDIKFVATNDGNLITDASVSATLQPQGGSGKPITGSASGSGLATASGPVGVNGNCPLSLTVER